MLIKELSPSRVESRCFLTFTFPCNLQLEDKSGLNEWLERMVIIHEDLKWLLSIPVSTFWNQVLFDPSWSVSLDSFLSNCPRAHDLRNIPDTCKTALSRVSKLFLLAIKRTTLHNESKDLYFTNDEHGELIYEHYLFDSAKLLDMCAIFNRQSNSIPQVAEIVRDVFHCQPKYYDDLTNTLESMKENIDILQDKLQVSRSISSKGCPVNGREAQDMLLFVYDMVMTFNGFLNIFPDASSVFFKAELIGKLALLSQSITPDILKMIEVNRKKYKYIESEVEVGVAGLVDLILQNVFIKYMENCDGVNLDELSVEYVNIMYALSQYPNFLARYCEVNSVLENLNRIERNGCVDSTSLGYVKNMISCVTSEANSDQILHKLRELLPMKGEQFLQKCIDTYGSNVDIIINNVLEGNISEDVKEKKGEKKSIGVPDKEILEDNKEHVALLKATFLIHSLDCDGDEFDREEHVYDDEYNDTYDSQIVAAQDADSADELGELTARRKFTIPDALRRLGDESEDSDDDDGNNETKDNRDKNKEDNTKEKQQVKYAGWNKRTSTGSRGGPRGRGREDNGKRGSDYLGGNRKSSRNPSEERSLGNSDTSTQDAGNNDQNRGNKERGRGRGRGHKHNRRFMSDKKKSAGMMPF